MTYSIADLAHLDVHEDVAGLPLSALPTFDTAWERVLIEDGSR